MSPSSDEPRPSGEDEILLRGNPDLLVVWSPFMGRGKADPATITSKIEEMAQFQTHMHLHCGGKGTKMIFILTSVPAEWTLPGERLMDRGVTLVNEVRDLIETNLDGSNRAIADLTSAANESEDLEARGSQQRNFNLPTIHDIRFSYRLSRSVNASHQQQLMLYHANPHCWIPMPVAIARPYAEFVTLLDDRMTAILREMHTMDGPDIATFFVTSSESEVEEMGVFKYEWVYDEVNRSIIDAQLKYLKNPLASTSPQSSNEEPIAANPIAVDVLCSCDYSTTKMDQLRKSVKKVADNQKTVPVPASLNFVPDA
jgi:hypothetical protein